MLDDIREIAICAGEEILRFYGRPHAVDYKADDSPLTLADRAAHELICGRLAQAYPDIPVISEESEVPEYEERKNWERFWLVDPLDGTKEFIKQTGEFTVNIALIVAGKPRLGVVYVPVSGLTYLAEESVGAFRQEREGERVAIRTRPVSEAKRLTVVASRDHAGPAVKELFARFPDAETRSMGSSLKFCLVAEGAADIYLRDVPTMEWDTAAAQCVVECAGGIVRPLGGRESLRYNKEDIRNPGLLTLGMPDFPWKIPGDED